MRYLSLVLISVLFSGCVVEDLIGRKKVNVSSSTSATSDTPAPVVSPVVAPVVSPVTSAPVTTAVTPTIVTPLTPSSIVAPTIATTPAPLSTNWADYKLEFGCGITYSGEDTTLPQAFTRIDQPIFVISDTVAGFITGLYYPSGETVEIYDDNNGIPGNLVGSSGTNNAYNPRGDNGGMCCDDRTFAWFLDVRITVIPGNLYHFVIVPKNPAEYSDFMVSNLNNGCASKVSNQMLCQSGDTWVPCNASNLPPMVQDILE